MSADEIIKLGGGFYFRPRELPDGTWCCVAQMIFTWAIIVGISPVGYSHRFCFEKREDAERGLANMQSRADEPAGYIARKP